MAIWRNKMTRLSAAGSGEVALHSLTAGAPSGGAMPTANPSTASMYFPQECPVQPDMGGMFEAGDEVVVVLRGTVTSMSESQYEDGTGSSSICLTLSTCTLAPGE